MADLGEGARALGEGAGSSGDPDVSLGGSPAPDATADASFLCGVIEGFYGRPWTTAQRAKLFAWMEAWGMNTYVYAPKDDLKLRAAWRLPYDAAELTELDGLRRDCARRGLTFVYTIAPGLDMRYAEADEMAALEAKVGQLLELGVTDLCLLFDDIPFRMEAADEARFGTFAAAQAYVANQLLAFARASNAEGLFLFCPTDYCGRMAVPSVRGSTYLKELGERLDPAIDVFWTGPEIVSETIEPPGIEELRNVLGRAPLIWENLHANDYDIRRVYLGPFDGRPSELRDMVRGVLTNPNDEFEANFIPIRSLALYAANDAYQARDHYDDLVTSWLPAFVTHGKQPIQAEELKLLVDLCYLPFGHGERGERLLAAARRALQHGSGGDDDDFDLIQRQAATMARLFEKLTELDDRELMHALYGYAWELRHELMYLADYLAWVRGGRPGGRFGKPDRLPNVYRLGLVATLEGLLPLDDDGAFHPRALAEPRG